MYLLCILLPIVVIVFLFSTRGLWRENHNEEEKSNKSINEREVTIQCTDRVEKTCTHQTHINQPQWYHPSMEGWYHQDTGDTIESHTKSYGSWWSIQCCYGIDRRFTISLDVWYCWVGVHSHTPCDTCPHDHPMYALSSAYRISYYSWCYINERGDYSINYWFCFGS